MSEEKQIDPFPKIEYGLGDNAWHEYNAFLRRLIVKHKPKRVCEVGAGANPSLSLRIAALYDLEYTIIDISKEELSKAPDGYLKVWADITAPRLELGQKYDLVFSKMVCEHIKAGGTFHKNVYHLLKEGGTAFHFFPTLFAPPFAINFILNRLLFERFAEFILSTFQAGREKKGRKGKFPAYYDWCRGPIHSQFEKFASLGYFVEAYIGFFGHSGYYKKIPILKRLNKAQARMLLRHPIPWLTSYAYVVLRKNYKKAAGTLPGDESCFRR